MTTSDDQPVYTEIHDSDVASTTHADPLGETTAAPAAAGAGAGRLLLAVLAALVAAAVGVAVWSYVYIWRGREYVGVSVVIGLAVGYLLRVVSRRSSLPVRILAVLITALACVVGTVVAEIAYTADNLGVGIGEIFGDYASRWRTILGGRASLTWGIFAAAVVLAYLSAMPQKPSKKKAAAAAPAGVVGRDDDEAAPDDEAGRDDQAPPPQLPAG